MLLPLADVTTNSPWRVPTRTAGGCRFRRNPLQTVGRNQVLRKPVCVLGGASRQHTELTRTPAALRRLGRIDTRSRSRRRSHASIWSMNSQPSPKPQIVSMLLVLTTSLFAFSACSEKVQGRTTFDSNKDGERIAFASNKGDDIDIYVMNADGSDVRQVTDEPGGDSFPAWSPEGTKIAFHRFRGETFDIYLINADGSGLRQLTSDPATDRFPAWSPDGNAMVFASDRDGDYDIYTMHADGSALEKLTDLPDDEGLPAWSAR